MPTPIYTRQFERDVKTLNKRGKDLDKLKIMVRALVAGEPLDPIHRDHMLVGSSRPSSLCVNICLPLSLKSVSVLRVLRALRG